MGQFRFRGEPVSLMAIVVNLFVSMGGYIFGYDIGYISGCLIMPHFQQAYGTIDSSSASGFALSSRRQSVVVALLSAGCFAGALLGVPTADFLGRRGAIFMVSVIFIVGVIVQIAPTGNLGAFIAGRFVAGLGVGALSALVPLYQGEISPKALRGAFVSCYQVMITFGILIAYILDFACKRIDGTASYKIPIGLQIIWGAILCAGVPFLPQSPRQSILTGNPEDARSVIARMHGIPIDDPLVQAYIDEITEKIEEEKHSGASYLDCFNFRNDLKTGQRTLIGCFVQSFQQLTGANFIFYYGTSIFGSINPSLDSYISQIIFGLLDMIGTLPGLYCLDRFGRRRTMITGALVMGLSYMLYAVIGSYALYPNNDATQVAKKGAGGGMLFVICVFVLAYGCSWGPGGWVNTGEIAPLRTRAKQLSFVSASNWVWNFLLSYFSPPISAKIGAKYGFVFFGANFLAAAFIYFFVPEMAGLSLEEINGLFQAGIPARKSFAYNRRIRQEDRKNQDIIGAGGEAKLGGQDTKEATEFIEA
ncbi:MFS sugar transporter [Heterobasidion irregulare TC 32-1]|uniref:MFS sugar transporter n=1 Tax=Heterobasidion irregulare (strain TC 32-1) TaxID=747525 RepID=W4JT33_HETIT|nr:MFS sugar transporter [Heterobasidion irregulare TC 32-1]ETW76260.1 MFS sugar transporter [Heterobasidion irregulare TC 32-1]